MRLVDADALQKDPLFLLAVDNYGISEIIEALPTVDAEPIRHGHWIGESQTKFEKLFFPQRVFKCSVCGNYLDFDGVNAGRGSANFCPNCGAKMDEEDRNDIRR